MPSASPRSRLGWVAVALFAAVLGGCKDEDLPIRSYEVPRVKQRLLGAVVPREDRVWFVKLVGPADAIDPSADDFDAFLASIRFPGDGDDPIGWTVPNAWTEEKSRERTRYATFRLPLGQELTVTVLPAQANEILPNVNRWRGQMELPPLTDETLPSVIREVKPTAGVKATRVDMSGIPAGTSQAGTAKPVKFEAPKAWKKMPPKNPDQYAVFQAIEGDDKAEVTVTAMGGAAGGLVANVNRWRGQVGLKPADEEAIRSASKKVDLGGVEGVLVDLRGDEMPLRILGVLANHGGRTWFVKMTGPAGVVEKQKPSFETFLGTVRFTEGK